ncbi:MAG: hypothetical protein IT371_14690 [Deltaproteobacteria bacterium]|nr:hypothetical protein [Deltaproteobacteria bacterium]
MMTSSSSRCRWLGLAALVAAASSVPAHAAETRQGEPAFVARTRTAWSRAHRQANAAFRTALQQSAAELFRTLDAAPGSQAKAPARVIEYRGKRLAVLADTYNVKAHNWTYAMAIDAEGRLYRLTVPSRGSNEVLDARWMRVGRMGMLAFHSGDYDSFDFLGRVESMIGTARSESRVAECRTLGRTASALRTQLATRVELAKRLPLLTGWSDAVLNALDEAQVTAIERALGQTSITNACVSRYSQNFSVTADGRLHGSSEFAVGRSADGMPWQVYRLGSNGRVDLHAYNGLVAYGSNPIGKAFFRTAREDVPAAEIPHEVLSAMSSWLTSIVQHAGR